MKTFKDNFTSKFLYLQDKQWKEMQFRKSKSIYEHALGCGIGNKPFLPISLPLWMGMMSYYNTTILNPSWLQVQIL